MVGCSVGGWSWGALHDGVQVERGTVEDEGYMEDFGGQAVADHAYIVGWLGCGHDGDGEESFRRRTVRDGSLEMGELESCNLLRYG